MLVKRIEQCAAAAVPVDTFGIAVEAVAESAEAGHYS